MDMDLEYARFMSELETVPREQAQPAAEAPAQSTPAAASAPAPVRPTLPPPPLGTHIADPPQSTADAGSLPPPPGRPPTLPPAPQAATARPSGLPPPILSAPAVFSAPAQPPSLPPASINPPAHPPPAVSTASTYGAYQASAQQAASASAQAFNPTLFNPASIREEILAEKKDGSRKKKPRDGVLRAAGGETWVDDKMDFWPPNDFRIFVGNLGPEVNEDILAKSFQHYPSYAKCRIVKDYKKNKAKAYGFVSFMDAKEGIKALKAMNGTYIGNRPCQLKKSNHEIRNVPTDDNKKRKAMIANPMERLTTKRTR